MSLEQITDGASELQAQVDAVTAKAQTLLDAYDQIGGEHVPASVRAAIGEQWGTALSALADEYLERYSKEDRAIDRKRVVKVDDALKILEAFEQEVIKNVVLDPASIISKSTLKTVRECEYVIEHAGSIITVLIETVSRFYKELARAAVDLIWDYFKFIYGNPATAIRIAIENYKFIAAAVVAVALGNIAATVIQDVLGVLDKTHFKTGIKPVLDAQKAFIVKAREKALPQGRGRVRRRKRGRK